MQDKIQINNYNMISAIILSGGKSSRMGNDKCELLYRGKTLLNFQVAKLSDIGLKDIIAAGYKGKKSDAKVVIDNISKGPLSGILVGLREIINDRALVISVDVPLVKKSIIKKLIEQFDDRADITIIRHNNKIEPLIGIYSKKIISNIEQVLTEDNYSVMRLIDKTKSEILDIDDEDKYFLNINYRKDYDELLEYDL